jgi:hypothetical protein
MKVYSLDIDSSERDATLHPSCSEYVVSLKNPIYNVSKISLVSAKIPNTQLLIHSANKSFTVDGTLVTLNETNYSNAHDLASDLLNELAPPVSNVTSIVYDDDTNALTFSNVGDSNAFTFEFGTGLNGYTSNTSSNTTPHQVLGFASLDYTSTNGRIITGALNLTGPTSIIVRLSSGSDQFNKTVYSNTPFYTGRILTKSGEIVHAGADDPLTHEFHSGPQRSIRDLRVEFFYMSHGRLIPYDFRNQDHVLKLEITGSTDKLESLPKVDRKTELPPPISIPELENPYRWKEYASIAMIVFIGIIALMLTKRKPLTPA